MTKSRFQQKPELHNAKNKMKLLSKNFALADINTASEI